MDEKSFIPSNQKPVVQVSNGPNSTALLKRGNIALEDGEFEEAKGFFNKVLNIDAECAKAYLGIAMAEEEFKSTKELIENQKTDNKNYQRAKRFADEALIESLISIENEVRDEIQLKLKKPIEKAKKACNIISSKAAHTVGVKSDGTVLATDYIGNPLLYFGQCDVSNWTDIVAVETNSLQTVGMKSDGTVVAVGYYGNNVSNWSDIVAISAGICHTVGLKRDGTVVAVGHNDRGQCNVSDWIDIVAVSGGGSHTVGLKSDGTVVATEFTCDQEEYNSRCNVSDWADIVAISAGGTHTVGLKSDGTVRATGNNRFGECNVKDWTNIVAVSAGAYQTVGMKSDGTVVAVGKNGLGECNVSDWTDIIAVSAGWDHTMGLKRDGTIIAVGDNTCGQCNVEKWKLFDNFDNLENERAQKIAEAKEKRIAEAKLIEEEKRIEEQKRIAEEKQRSAYRSQDVCQHCGGKFKGFFSKKCSNCGKEKDY